MYFVLFLRKIFPTSPFSLPGLSQIFSVYISSNSFRTVLTRSILDQCSCLSLHTLRRSRQYPVNIFVMKPLYPSAGFFSSQLNLQNSSCLLHTLCSQIIVLMVSFNNLICGLLVYASSMVLVLVSSNGSWPTLWFPSTSLHPATHPLICFGSQYFHCHLLTTTDTLAVLSSMFISYCSILQYLLSNYVDHMMELLFAFGCSSRKKNEKFW